MNILNKKDRSIAPTFGGNHGLTKEKKFNWASPSSPGEFRMVDKRSLNIDGDYQRDQVSEGKILAIAREWDWKLFGVLSVVERPDHTLWVYDGGHRTRAAFLRSDIHLLPAMVFHAEEMSDEAKAFVGANTMQSAVNAYSRYKAGIVAEEPEAMQIQQMLQDVGLEAKSHAKPGVFSAINTLRRLIARDSDLAGIALAALHRIADGVDVISGEALAGVFDCARKLPEHDIFSGRHFDRLADAGIKGIEIAIRREKHLAGSGGPAVAAKAVLDLLNKGLQKKLKF